MELALIGLGKMGSGMSRRLLKQGFRVAGYDVNPGAVAALEPEGLRPLKAIQEVRTTLTAPRIVWLMLPAGTVTEEAVQTLGEVLEAGDLVVDGGNAFYKDSMRRAAWLEARGIQFADVGVSGGVWGERHGYGLMMGATAAAAARLEPILKALAPAPDKGWVHVGPVGAGHFAKMVHNGIEYALMQAYAEGFEILRQKKEFRIDLARLAEAWRHGTVIRSWLLDLTAAALAEDQDLEGVAPYVPDSGEGRWTVQEAVDLGVPVPTISGALWERFASQQEARYAYKLLAVMRRAFGGHAVKRNEG
ncbi:phosphogluconate dehydrogenase (NAD(+)-dependent, decarboxylating) [Marinithermus hydrothermalis]|uniref:6-phosphogluconate dehydrogenase, decarboxylating n=1 Tax=Marinithermus hydrothermalis (strain DSM 14884 / JCM 11576 / T1) TaxID=869210 RepID=F2NLE7_MARHT|nr:decarboxylating 6-phosphogluconate dehydrogenase [Marinithermus hydrothermalis]AEB11766.1 6-phosphogluconate dehydrogenase, decarboxylating [Marinithermus hydrothermalis DSM 14884]